MAAIVFWGEREMERARIERAIAAAQRLRDEHLPTAEELAAAPLLNDWLAEPLAERVVRLVGVVSGHPSIANGWCTTSAVLWISDDMSCCRTVGRLYRLGRPLPLSGRSQ
jgi:hypothetical protein